MFCDLSFASTGLLLAVQKWSTNKSDFYVVLHCCSSTCMQGMGCNELGKNTIFNEHPVPAKSSRVVFRVSRLLRVYIKSAMVYVEKVEKKTWFSSIIDRFPPSPRMLGTFIRVCIIQLHIYRSFGSHTSRFYKQNVCIFFQAAVARNLF